MTKNNSRTIINECVNEKRCCVPRARSSVRSVSRFCRRTTEIGRLIITSSFFFFSSANDINKLRAPVRRGFAFCRIIQLYVARARASQRYLWWVWQTGRFTSGMKKLSRTRNSIGEVPIDFYIMKYFDNRLKNVGKIIHLARKFEVTRS